MKFYTCWLHRIRRCPMFAFKSPSTMGSFPGNWFNAYSSSVMCSRADMGKYDPMSGVRCLPVTTSQLTTFGLWKHIDSTLHLPGRSLRPTPPLRPPGRSEHRLGAHGLVYQAVMSLLLVGDIYLHQQHQVVVSELYRPDCLGEAKYPAALDVVNFKIVPWGGGLDCAAVVTAPHGCGRFHDGEVE